MGSSSSTAKKQKAVSAFKQTVTQNTNNSSSSKEPVRNLEKKETTNQNSDTANHNQVTVAEPPNQNLDTANQNQVTAADSANKNKDSISSPSQKPAVFSGLGEMDRWQDADIAGLLSGLSLEEDDGDIWKDTVDQLITRYDPKIQPDKKVCSSLSKVDIL